MTVLCQGLVFKFKTERCISSGNFQFNETASVGLCLIKWDLNGFRALTTQGNANEIAVLYCYFLHRYLQRRDQEEQVRMI